MKDPSDSELLCSYFHTFHTIIPKYAREEFSMFDGNDDVGVWINRCERCFQKYSIYASNQAFLSSDYFKGGASLWFR